MKARPYQEKAIEFLVREGKGIVRGPTGCGKTFISLQAAMEIGWDRLLIVVPRYSALLSWEKELERLGIAHTIIKKWSPQKRREFWLYGAGGEEEDPSADYTGRIVVALYPTVCKDIETLMSPKCLFDFVICDECHRIKDRRTLSHKAIKRLARGKKRFFLSATLQSKGPEDLWSPLHIVQPSGFPSYHKFVDRYCVIENDGYSDKIVGVKKSTLGELRFRTKPYIHNIRTQDIEGFVPKRVRQPLHVELNPRVRRVYRQLWKDSMLVLPDGNIFLAPGQLAKFTAVRKLLTCPQLVHDNLGVGDALEAVWDHAHGETPKPHAVIFSDFKEPFPIWEHWLKKQGGKVTILQGGMTDTDIKIAIDQFSRSSDIEQSWLLCTIPFAESFDLLSPQDAYFIGWAWDQNRNYQAEGRLTRGSKSHANFFYCLHDGTVDEHMLGVLDVKVQNTKLVVSDVEGS